VLPARPRAPPDKAKVEAAVQHVERWIMAPLRNQTFFSLGELRDAIAPLLAVLNERPFEKTEGSRSSWFEDLDRPALKPLPAQRYEYAEWRKALVNIDYHIQAGRALYSVPYPLARHEVDVRITAQTVEIFHKHRRVAAHLRIHRRGGYANEPSHMPAVHRAHAEWTPSRLIAWGRKAGPHTGAFVEQLLESRPHPEQGYRSCLGLMKLLRAYSAERLEAACRRALDIGAHSYRRRRPALAVPARRSRPRPRTGLLRQLPQRKGVVTNMLRQPTLDLLHELRRAGMAQAFEEQLAMPDIRERAFEDRLSLLLDQLALARGRLIPQARPAIRQDLAPVLDDWGLASLTGQGRHDLLEVLDDRYARRGTILDRVVLNNAHRITLKGGSMRRLYDSTQKDHDPHDHA